MYQKLDCIALRTVKYSDRNSILTVFSRQEGRLAFLVPAGKGKEANRLRALLMPLGQFECVADLRPGRDIHNIKDVRPTSLPPMGDPLRSTIALFITDLFTDIIKESMVDPQLFQFVEWSIKRLNDSKIKGIQNFHIWFLMHLARFLGIEPDWGSYREGAVFDLAEGVFRASPPLHRNFLATAESEFVNTLRRINYRNLDRFRFSRFDRNRVLDIILLYYRLHYPSLGVPTSLSVLRVMAD